MPYILPENVQPDTLLCLKVYIPNDQLYLEAFSGAFNDFGRWTQWQRDGTNGASLAATIWKDAIDYTFANAWLNCGETMDCCQEILDRLTQIELGIQGLNNMNINVSSCGCGCGCGGGISQGDLPTQTTDLPIPPIPSSDAPTTPIDSWKCDAANQVWSDWYELFTSFQASVIAGDATIAALIAIAGALSVITGGLSVLLAILAGAAGAAAATTIGWVRDWLEANQDGIVCAIVSASTPAQASANALAYISANASTPLGVTVGFFVKNQLTAVASDTDWNVVFNPGSITISPSLVGSDCSGCSLSTPPEAVAGYEWRRAELLQDVQASAYTLTKLIGSTGYRYTAQITAAATNWDTMIKAVKPTLAPGESVVGFTMMVTESFTDGGINDPGNGHVRITGLVTAYDGAPPYRNLIVSSGDGGVHQTALTPAAPWDLLDSVSSSVAAQERTLIHYARVGTGEIPPGNITFAVAEVYYAVKLA
jgi:hypothetical protein